MNHPDATNADSQRRDAGVRRTAWIAGAVAVGVYAAFMLAAML